MEDGVIKSLIKRTTGPHSGQSQGERRASADGRTLGEKIASQREQAGADAPRADMPAAETPAPAPMNDHDAIVEAAKRARDGARPAGKAQRTCLVVDDSRVVRKVSRGIVESLGFAVIEAENGEEALARCRASMPDLVLTDWDMPVMSGLEFVQALRALPGADAAKVVFCTSKGAAQDIHDGIAAGADDYVLKPFDASTLKPKLAKLNV